MNPREWFAVPNQTELCSTRQTAENWAEEGDEIVVVREVIPDTVTIKNAQLNLMIDLLDHDVSRLGRNSASTRFNLLVELRAIKLSLSTEKLGVDNTKE